MVVLDYKYSMAEKKEKQRQIDGKLKKMKLKISQGAIGNDSNNNRLWTTRRESPTVVVLNYNYYSMTAKKEKKEKQRQIDGN